MYGLFKLAHFVGNFYNGYINQHRFGSRQLQVVRSSRTGTSSTTSSAPSAAEIEAASPNTASSSVPFGLARISRRYTMSHRRLTFQGSPRSHWQYRCLQACEQVALESLPNRQSWSWCLLSKHPESLSPPVHVANAAVEFLLWPSNPQPTIGLMTIPYYMEMMGVWTPAHRGITINQSTNLISSSLLPL